MSNQALAQDDEGLLSPFLRKRRFKAITSHIPLGSVVLDLACGSGQLRHYLTPDCRYMGADRSSAASAALGGQFLAIDLARLDAFAEVDRWLPLRPQVIILTAILEHIGDPGALLAACSTLLPPQGLIVGTTPHPRGRFLHDAFARCGLCSREAANEHETFLGHSALSAAAVAAQLELFVYKQFLCGLNQVFVLRKGPRS
jgi:SAM-dependent methyltransferase